MSVAISLRKRFFWSLYAGAYDAAWACPITDDVAYAIGDLRGAATVVDLGCGTGLFAAGLACAGVEVTGVDRSPSMLARAVSKARISTPIQADAAETGLPSEAFDAVICANLLHLHHDPAAVIGEALRLAQPGGLIALVTPTQGLSQERVVVADVRSGRSIGRSLRAHAVRALATPGAIFAGIRPRPATEVLGVIEQAESPTLKVLTVEAFSGTQILVLMQKSGAEQGVQSSE